MSYGEACAILAFALTGFCGYTLLSKMLYIFLQQVLYVLTSCLLCTQLLLQHRNHLLEL